MDSQAAITHILDRLKQELPDHLHYHGHHHTVDVLQSVELIAASENVSKEEMELLSVATAYHDCGFLTEYKDHEKHGCDIARSTLPKFGFANEQVGHICEMIMATKVPQQPNGRLAKILCDADLEYLGTDRFKSIGDQLFDELMAINAVADRREWDEIQVSFLTQHRYFTTFCKQNRQPRKEQHLEDLRSSLG